MAHPDTRYYVKIHGVLEKHLGVDESVARWDLEGALYDVVQEALREDRAKARPVKDT